MEGDDGVPQLVFYDPGIGATGNFVDRLRGGAFGSGIDQNIQELYAFLAMNYTPGDEIMLFGYSRGAYTVRSLAGLIHEAGLVRRGHLDFVREAYEMYRDRQISPDSPTAVAFRATHGERVPIKLLACFDTVGALGLPVSSPWPFSAMVDDERYRFHNTTLSDAIEHAVHAVSIDEDRLAFEPTFMTPSPERGSAQVTELFLPGFHGGVGGGSEAEQPLAENALRFVVDEIKKRGISLGIEMNKIPAGGNYNVSPRKLNGWLNQYELLKIAAGSRARNIGSVDRLHPIACRRFAEVEEWRPEALVKYSRGIMERALKLFA